MKEEIEQWTENHRAAVVISDVTIEQIESRIVTFKREKEADSAEQAKRRIQRRLEEERRIIEMQMQMKKKEEKEKEEKKKEESLLNNCKFSKTKFLCQLLLGLMTLTLPGLDFATN